MKGANSQKPNDFVTASHSWPEFLRIIRLGFNACRLIRGHKIGQICEWNGKRCDTSFISLSWDFILLDFKIELNNNNTFFYSSSSAGEIPFSSSSSCDPTKGVWWFYKASHHRHRTSRRHSGARKATSFVWWVALKLPISLAWVVGGEREEWMELS